jgi:hypothetical protein
VRKLESKGIHRELRRQRDGDASHFKLAYENARDKLAANGKQQDNHMALSDSDAFGALSKREIANENA